MRFQFLCGMFRQSIPMAAAGVPCSLARPLLAMAGLVSAASFFDLGCGRSDPIVCAVRIGCMTRELDPWHMAAELFRLHGSAASGHALSRADQARKKRDTAGFDIWIGIAANIQHLRQLNETAQTIVLAP